MFEKLGEVEDRFMDLENSLSRPGLSPDELTKMSRERASIEPVVETYRRYKELLQQQKEAQEMLADGDDELKELAKEELELASSDILKVEEELTLLTLPKDPNDERNVIMEIRAGTGGDEASLFSADLFRMYSRYAEKNGWKIEMISSTESGAGGFKEVSMLIEGEAVFSRLKFESGVHRVQRVPTTESQGRVHTSACTVAILPEAEEVDVDINPSDLDIGTFRASGAGGQHVNTTDSAVRILHRPSGIVVECQEERSQHKNRDKAMKVLRARILEVAQIEQADAISADRKVQVGSGDRSERIRTYNFPQGRMTDHRINLTLYKLDQIIEGDIKELLDALGTNYQAELLKNQSEEG